MGSQDLSEEDKKRLIEILDEVIQILKDDPQNKMERLKKIRDEAYEIRMKIEVADQKNKNKGEER